MVSFRKILINTFCIFLIFASSLTGLVYFYMIRPLQLQMRYGHEYMSSLTYDDVIELVKWVDDLLIIHSDLDGYIDIPLTEKWLDLKVARIEVYPPSVVYIAWLGGIDHTGLKFVKDMDTKDYAVYSIYNDDDVRMIYEAGDWKGR